VTSSSGIQIWKGWGEEERREFQKLRERKNIPPLIKSGLIFHSVYAAGKSAN